MPTMYETIAGLPVRLIQRWGRPAVLWGAAFVALLLVLYWDVGGVFAARWLGKSDYYHCLAVPPLVGWLVWRRWDRLMEAGARPSAAGIGLLGLGLAVAVIGARLGVNLIIGLSFPFVMAGLALLLWGPRVLLMLTGPLVVLFFAIPPPQHALGMITMPMQKVSAIITEHAAQATMGIPVVRDGLNLELYGHKYVVAEACSGMSSFLAMCLTVVVLIEFAGLTAGRRLFALATIPAIVICANVIRLCLVLLTAQYFGPEVAGGDVVHGVTDAIVYLSALIMVIMFLNALAPHEEVVEVIEEVEEAVAPACADQAEG